MKPASGLESGFFVLFAPHLLLSAQYCKYSIEPRTSRTIVVLM
jgi:hypothetical protein